MDSTLAEKEYVRSGVRYVVGVDEAGRGCMAGPVGVAATLYRISASAVRYPVGDSKAVSERVRESTLDCMCTELGMEGSAAFLQRVMDDGACCVAQRQSRSSLQAVAAVLVDVAVVNARNILNATLEGMSAVCALLVSSYNAAAPQHAATPANCAILVDGNRLPWTFLTEEQRRDICAKAERKAEMRKRVGVVHAALDGYACTTVVGGDGTLLSIAAASIAAKVARDAFAVHRMHLRYPVYGFLSHKGYCTKEHTRLLQQHGPCPYHRLDYGPVKAALAEH